MPDILVVGAGIVGASLAFGLARRGANVTVLEADRPAAGTSKSSFAWPNANYKLPRDYFELNAAGLAEHHRLAAELGHGAFQATGNLEVAAGAERRAYQEQKVVRLRDWGYAAEPIDRSRARELVPDLIPPADASFAFYPNEGWVAAPLLTYHLLEAAKQSGATVRFPARVTALTMKGPRVIGAIVNGERVAADLVIDCAGPAAAELLRPLGLAIGRQRSPGLLVVTEPMPNGLSRVLHTPRAHLRPGGIGRVLIGSEEIDAGLPVDPAPTADSPECQELLRRAQAVLPTLAGARIEAVRLGWRPLPADGLSAVGPVPGVEGYYLVFTHSGVTLGPVLGRLVAADVLTGAPDPLLAPFRPDRLVTPV
ncbi:MAG: NAD(P)/FAD-dependent oxidoreductase [Chloroflexota bacterium]